MRRWILYSLGGMTTYSIKLAVSAALVEVAGLGFVISYGLATATVFLYSFWYNKLITFSAAGTSLRQLPVYLVVLGIFNGVDFGLTVLLTAFGVAYPVAITIVTILLFVAKFPVFKTIVFREHT